MAAERRAREKSRGSKGSSPCSNDSGHMELDSLTETDVEGLSVQDHSDHALSSSDEEGHKRKRSEEFSHTPKELMRSGKRPSLTPPPSDSVLPPPGMMNPDDVTDHDLSQLVVFQGDRASMLTVSTYFFLHWSKVHWTHYMHKKSSKGLETDRTISIVHHCLGL